MSVRICDQRRGWNAVLPPSPASHRLRLVRERLPYQGALVGTCVPDRCGFRHWDRFQIGVDVCEGKGVGRQGESAGLDTVSWSVHHRSRESRCRAGLTHSSRYLTRTSYLRASSAESLRIGMARLPKTICKATFPRVSTRFLMCPSSPPWARFYLGTSGSTLHHPSRSVVSLALDSWSSSFDDFQPYSYCNDGCRKSGLGKRPSLSAGSDRWVSVHCTTL